MSFWSAIIGIFNKTLAIIAKIKTAVDKLLNTEIGIFVVKVIKFVLQKTEEVEGQGLTGDQKKEAVFTATLDYCKEQQINYENKWINFVIELVLLLNQFGLLDWLV